MGKNGIFALSANAEPPVKWDTTNSPIRMTRMTLTGNHRATVPLFEIRSEVTAPDGTAVFDYPVDLSLVNGDFFSQVWGIGPLPGAYSASPGLR